MKKIPVMQLLFTVIVLASALSILLGGCRKPSTPAFESPLPTPSRVQIFVSPQSTPTSIPIPILPTPFSADVATVGGVLIRDFPGQGSEPMANATLYLARVIRSKDGTAMMAVVEDTSPKAMTDKNGVFIFTGVPSNTYGIAISTPLGSFLIKNERGDDFLVVVQSGAILDLGEVHTDLPY